MVKRIDTDAYKIVNGVDKALAGEVNKIKLKAVSYSVILEVQQYYMEEELRKLEEQKKVLENVAEGEEDEYLEEKARSQIKKIEDEMEIVIDSLDVYEENKEKFAQIAKKILTLPEANFEEMEKKGVLADYEDDLEYSYDDALIIPEDSDVFMNVDVDAIKEAVDKAMDESLNDKDQTLGEKIIKKVDDENYNDLVTNIAKKVKTDFDNENSDDIDFADAAAILNSPILANNLDIDLKDDLEDDFDNVDFSNDEELMKIRAEKEELAKSLSKATQSISDYDLAKEKLDREREEKRVIRDNACEKAKSKSIEAKKIEEERKYRATVDKEKEELRLLREKVLSANNIKREKEVEVLSIKDDIKNLDNEIESFNDSIRNSEEIINNYGRKM